MVHELPPTVARRPIVFVPNPPHPIVMRWQPGWRYYTQATTAVLCAFAALFGLILFLGSWIATKEAERGASKEASLVPYKIYCDALFEYKRGLPNAPWSVSNRHKNIWFDLCLAGALYDSAAGYDMSNKAKAWFDGTADRLISNDKNE